MRIAGFLLAILFSSAVWAADAYLPGTADVPLFDGLTVRQAGEGVQFDTPEGQILIVEAESETRTVREVMDFYRKSLPALGWKKKKGDVFEREDDSFSIVVVQEQKPLIVRFELVPRD